MDHGSGVCLILTLGQLPPVTERLKSDDVMKLCQDEWQPRRLVLTALDLVLTQIDSDSISDRIPLVMC
jgi:hypothetical protein